MNKVRRKELDKAAELITEAIGIIETVRSDEEDALSNLPESLQEGEKGDIMTEAIDQMDTVMDELRTAADDTIPEIQNN